MSLMFPLYRDRDYKISPYTIEILHISSYTIKILYICPEKLNENVEISLKKRLISWEHWNLGDIAT